MYTDSEIITGCCKKKRVAQKALYEKYVPKLRAVCYRYLRSEQEIEDVIHDTFIKIFDKIKQFKGDGPIEAWMKRILVNYILDYLKKRQKIKHNESYDINQIEDVVEQENESGSKEAIIRKAEPSKEVILELANELPQGCKIIFNLYVVEKYKHKEIAATLGISVGTSKSQLQRARLLLKDKLFEKCKRK